MDTGIAAIRKLAFAVEIRVALQEHDAAPGPVKGAPVDPERTHPAALLLRQSLVDDVLRALHHQRRLEREIVPLLLLQLLLLLLKLLLLLL